MWTEKQRRIYRREGDGYPSDLRATEWAQLEPLIPSARPGGRPRKNRHARGDERHLVPAHRLSVALPATRRLSATLGRSTTSFASSSAKGSGRRSGPSCTWPCASGWGAKPAPRPQFSIANRSNRRKRGGKDDKVGYDAGKKVKGRKSTPWSTAKGCRCGSSFTPLRSRIATGPGWCSTRYDGDSRGANPSGPMAATTHGRLTLRAQRCRCCAWRSSSGATT
jgi:hypothetical protein